MWKWIPIPVQIFRLYEQEQYSICLSRFVSSKLQYPMSSQVSKQSLPEGFYWPIVKHDGMLILLRSLYINPNLFLQPVIPQVGTGVLGPLKNEQINPSACTLWAWQDLHPALRAKTPCLWQFECGLVLWQVVAYDVLAGRSRPWIQGSKWWGLPRLSIHRLTAWSPYCDTKSRARIAAKKTWLSIVGISDCEYPIVSSNSMDIKCDQMLYKTPCHKTPKKHIWRRLESDCPS